MADIPHVMAPSEPSLKDAFDALKQDIFATLNCHHIGQIQTFNPATQTATATINYKKTYFERNPVTGTYDAVLKDYPLLIDAPVVVLGGGTLKGALTFPIATGDDCMVLFNDRDLDNWYQGSTSSPVATPRLHSFADAVLLVGLRSLPNVLTGYDAVRAVLRQGTALVGVGAGGGTLVKIANATTTLNTLLQSLVAQVSALATAAAAITVSGVTTGGGTSAVPVNAPALAAVATNLATISTQIAGLLE